MLRLNFSKASLACASSWNNDEFSSYFATSNGRAKMAAHATPQGSKHAAILSDLPACFTWQSGDCRFLHLADAYILPWQFVDYDKFCVEWDCGQSGVWRKWERRRGRHKRTSSRTCEGRSKDPRPQSLESSCGGQIQTHCHTVAALTSA